MMLGGVALAIVGGLWSGGIAVGVLVLLAGYRFARSGLSKADRRTGRLIVTWLRNWLPPLLVLAAGAASWMSARPNQDAIPQLLALAAMVLLWLGLLGRPMPPTARSRRKALPGQLDHVITDDGQYQSATQHKSKGAHEAAGEFRAAAGPIDQGDYQRVP